MGADEQLQRLEERIDELLALCRRLRRENQTLRAGQQGLQQENVRLAEKTQVARVRIEAIIGRLKALEHSAP